jgi:hypothetical protein
VKISKEMEVTCRHYMLIEILLRCCKIIPMPFKKIHLFAVCVAVANDLKAEVDWGAPKNHDAVYRINILDPSRPKS